jgi:hypothetical protein
MEKKYIEEKLDEMQDTIYGKAMIAYLEAIVNEIDTVRDAPTLQETRGREIACRKIEKIIQRLQKVESVKKQAEYI